VDRIRLWRSNRKTLVSDVMIDDGRLILQVEDTSDRARLQEVFDRTGEVTWAWTRRGEEDWTEQRAQPGTSTWLWFVVANILYPMGYQADFGVTD
jgi:hypothetical protein